MSEFKIQNVVLQKYTDNQGKLKVKMLSPRKADIEIKGNIERFAEKFIDYLSTKVKFLSFNNEDEKIDAITSLVGYLLSKEEREKQEEFTIEVMEPERKEAVVSEEQKVVEVPLTKYAEKEEVKEEKERKELEIDMTKLMERFNQLKAVNIPRDRIFEILSEEFNVSIDALNRLIPIVPKAEVKPVKVAEKKQETVQPTPVTEVTEAPKAPVVEEEFDIKKVPGYQYLSPTLINGLEELARRVYHKTPEELVQMYIKEAKRLPVTSETSWLNLAFRDMYQHNIIKVVKEKVHYLMFYISENGEFKAYPVVADRKITNLYIDRCYELPELGKAGRLVGISQIPTDISNYPDLPKVTQVNPIGDLPVIPKAYQVYEPVSLSEILKLARESPNKRVEEAFFATIIQINPWSSEDGCFVVVYDGSDVPMYGTKITLRYDNPFGIDEETVINSQGRQVLCYGLIKYEEADERFPERLTVHPFYLTFVE
jgi:hypothetical protein